MRALLLCLLALPLISAAQAPSKDLEPLAFLVGDWQSTFTRKSPAGKEEKVSSKVKTRFRLEGQFLEMEDTQSIDGKTPTTTLLLVTFDSEKKAYQGYIFTSSFPTFPMSVLGEVRGDRLTFVVDAETSPVKASFVYEKSPEGYRSSSSVKMGDKDLAESAVYKKSK